MRYPVCSGNTFLQHVSSILHTLEFSLYYHYYYIFTANADSKTKGVLTVIGDTVAFVLHKEIKDPQGYFLILVCDINLVTYTIVNVYAPNVHQICFFPKLMMKICAHRQGLLVLFGDFNATPDPTIDTTSRNRHTSPSLQAAFHEQDLYDVWQCFQTGEKDFTFFSAPHRVY